MERLEIVYIAHLSSSENSEEEENILLQQINPRGALSMF